MDLALVTRRLRATLTRPRTTARAPHGRLAWAYLLCALALTAVYPLVPAWRGVEFLLVSCASVPAVAVGLRRIRPGARLPWWLLLSGLVVLNIANIIRVSYSGVLDLVGRALDAAGIALVFAAALGVVLRRGRNDIGGVIDSTIVALAVGGLLWDFLLLPHMQAVGRPAVARVALFAIVFVLGGILGALLRVLLTTSELIPAMWLLAAALAFSFAGNMLVALTTGWVVVVAEMMFLVSYAALGLFGLEPSAPRLVRSGSAPRDALTAGRLVFLGLALAVVPVSSGVQELAGRDIVGLFPAVGGTVITLLVMIRIGQLAAERAKAERALRHEASHDPLTGLANRREFIARVSAELRRPRECVVLFCDLDGFKRINDRLGHRMGDRLLVEVARRLVGSVRDSDLVGRFGGDEFLILFPDTTLAEADRLCTRLAEVLGRPITLGDEMMVVGASIGAVVGVGTAGGVDDATEDLIHQADHAMYSAKQTRRSIPGVRVVSH